MWCLYKGGCHQLLRSGGVLSLATMAVYLAIEVEIFLHAGAPSSDSVSSAFSYLL